MKGKISNIQRFSLDDGPGVRTTVFFKGCNLRCIWCHNPECISLNSEIQLYRDKCTGCGQCLNVCAKHAIQLIDDRITINRDLCIQCGQCVDACLHAAITKIGNERTVEEIVEAIEKDRIFYKKAGGVTFSGGEPLLQPRFLKALLLECKERNLNTAVDTAGNVGWEIFEEIIPYTDLFLFDVKLFSDSKHQKATGVRNAVILKNLRKLAELNQSDIWVRIPIIPSINDNISEMALVAEFLKELETIQKIELLPYHKYGIRKYETLGLKYQLNDIDSLENDKIEALRNEFRKRGLQKKI